MPYSYAQAIEKLGDTEKNRMIAIFLSKDDPAADYTAAEWKKATTAYGSASIESMKKSLTNSLKKIVATDADDNDDDVPAAGAVTAKKSKAGRPPKRKAEATEDDGDAAEQPASPVKKRGRGRPAKTTKTKTAVKAEENAEEEVADAEDGAQAQDDEAEKEVPAVQKRGRGRPPKANKGKGKGKGKKAVVNAEEDAEDEVADAEAGAHAEDEEIEDFRAVKKARRVPRKADNVRHKRFFGMNSVRMAQEGAGEEVGDAEDGEQPKDDEPEAEAQVDDEA